ncbi:MAG TPA: hypothetical protein VFP50_09270 [Anaeromyxobacteraceae bacterium]|nr:hypothetical protein [Anaeromyxobacteraceae bacterium]
MVTRSAPAPAGAPSLRHLPACVEDAQAAALQRDDGPPDPTAFAALEKRLAAAGKRLPCR